MRAWTPTETSRTPISCCRRTTPWWPPATRWTTPACPRPVPASLLRVRWSTAANGKSCPRTSITRWSTRRGNGSWPGWKRCTPASRSTLRRWRLPRRWPICGIWATPAAPSTAMSRTWCSRCFSSPPRARSPIWSLPAAGSTPAALGPTIPTPTRWPPRSPRRCEQWPRIFGRPCWAPWSTGRRSWRTSACCAMYLGIRSPQAA